MAILEAFFLRNTLSGHFIDLSIIPPLTNIQT